MYLTTTVYFNTVFHKTQKYWYLPVVRCREDSYTFAIMCNLIAVLFHFMAANNIFKVIRPQESICYIWTKVNTNSALAWRPAILRLRIRPQQLTHHAWYIHKVHKAMLAPRFSAELWL